MPDWTHTHVLSDTHGWFDLMIEMLGEQGLVDNTGKWVAGPGHRLIHLGDSVDRGPDSVKTFMWLRDLQTQLGPEQVVRLIGNHEFAFCGGPSFYGTDQQVHDSSIPDLMVEDGKAGVLKFAESLQTEDGQWLLVHGGLDPRIMEGGPMSAVARDVAEHLNDIGVDFFNEYIPNWRYSQDRLPEWAKRMGLTIEEARDSQEALEQECDILQGISRVRGGYGSVSGVTWCDIKEELVPQMDKLQVRQIVGHRSHDEITFYDDKLIGVNVHYGLAQLLTYDHASGLFDTSRLHRSETHQWDPLRGPQWK